MSGAVDFVEDTLGAVGDVVDSVGKIAESAVREVGHAVESVGREVGKIGQAAVNNPIGTIAKVAAVASGQWWALPLVSAVDVVAHGGNLEQAALSAGVSLAASWAGGQIASQIAAPAADSVASMATADAASMVAQNIPAEQISQVLQQSYGITGNIAESIANASTAGISASTLATSYAGAFGQQLTGVADAFTEKLISTSLGNSAANFGVKLVQTGGDVEKALAAGAGAGIGTAFGGYVAKELVDAGANPTLSQITGKITSAATSGIVQGQDPSKALGTALVNNIISTSYAQAGALFKEAWSQSGAEKLFSDIGSKVVNALNTDATAQKAASEKAAELEKQQNGIADNYNALIKTASSYYNDTVVPTRAEAERLQAVAEASYNEYKPLRDQFSSYISQYDAAKAAYDGVKVPDPYDPWGEGVQNQNEIDAAKAERERLANQMNDLADKANALVPQINAATDRYNADASTFQASADRLNSVASQYNNYNNQITELKNNYTNVNTQFTEAVKVANAAADKFNATADDVQKQVDEVIKQKAETDKIADTLDPDAKKAYQNAFSAGEMPVDAVEIGNQVNSLSSNIAQRSFNQSFDEGLSLTESLEIAQEVNGLAKPQQNYFSFATNTGLNTAEALAVSPTLSGMTVTAQQAFFDQLNNNKLAPTEALDWAKTVNALGKDEQIAYNTAVTNGLTHEQALGIAPDISSFSTSQQAAYVDSIKQGMSEEAADFVSALSSFGGNYTDKSTVDENAANLSKLTTDDQKQAYSQLVSGAGGLQVSPEKAMAFVTQGIDPISGQKIAENIISTLTGSGNAQAGELPPTGETYTTEGKYVQDAAGNWSIVGTDKDGKPLTIYPFVSIAGDVPVSGSSAGQYSISTDPNAKEGFTAAPTKLDQANVQTDIASQVDSADGKTVIVTLKGGATEVYDKATGELLSTVNTPVQTPTIDQTIGGTSTWQDYINDLLTKSKATTGSGSGTTGTSGTGTSGGTTAGSGTGTTGGTTPGGPVAGTGSTPGGTSNAGTGSGIGSTPGGAGTGEGTGTGTGTGGTGTGTGGGGTGTGGGGGGTGTGGFGIATGGYGTWLSAQGQDQYGGIKNLTPGLTERMDYTLTGMPNIQENINPMSDVNTNLPPAEMATGGSTTYDPFAADTSGIKSSLTPGLTKAQIQYVLAGMPGANISVQGRAEGGSIEGHNPEFFSEGGLGSLQNKYVKGAGDGTSDSIPAMLANGEFVIPADVVSSLGNGSNEAGASVLDQFLKSIRDHKHSKGSKGLPPDSKGPLSYLTDAKRKAKVKA